MVLSVLLRERSPGWQRSSTQEVMSNADSHRTPVLPNHRCGAWVCDKPSRWFWCTWKFENHWVTSCLFGNTLRRESLKDSPLSYWTIGQKGVLENIQINLLVFFHRPGNWGPEIINGNWDLEHSVFWHQSWDPRYTAWTTSYHFTYLKSSFTCKGSHVQRKPFLFMNRPRCRCRTNHRERLSQDIWRCSWEREKAFF